MLLLRSSCEVFFFGLIVKVSWLDILLNWILEVFTFFVVTNNISEVLQQSHKDVAENNNPSVAN